MTVTKKPSSPPSKTILHLIDTTGPGGAETVFIQLADKLRDLGCNSIVVIRGEGWVNDELIRRTLNPIIIPAKGSFELGFLLELIKILRTHRVDVIQSHLLGSNVYASMAGLVTRTPVVATYHGMVDVNPNERFKWLKNNAMKFGISRYVAVSQRLLENIKTQGLLTTEKACVIYNGVDLERYSLSKKSTQLRDKLNISEGSFLVGSLGNIRPAKAYNRLIDAGAQLVKKYPFMHFVIAGHRKKSLMEALENQLTSLGVEGHFHFIGFSDDSAGFLRQMDMFVLSSSSEGFSISTIEAMASGLPVVVTQCGGPEEIVTSEVDALLVNVDDSDAIADGVSRIMNEPMLAQKLAANGKLHVERTFSLARMLKSYNAIYNELIVK